ncbi:hypothetical protein D3C72_1626320 [compost metagenome]
MSNAHGRTLDELNSGSFDATTALPSLEIRGEMVSIGDEIYYLDNVYFYRVQVVAISDYDQVLVDEDGNWRIFNINELYAKEAMLEKKKELNKRR